MRLAYIILAHNDTGNLFRLIKKLALGADRVVVHWDKKNTLDLEALAQDRLTAKTLARLSFAPRVAVEWGHWSMVEATLAALEELERCAEAFDYVVLLSGADYLIKPVSALKTFLVHNSGKEFIECVDPDQDAWVVQGLVKDRFLHHHWFNWRNNPRMFDWSLQTQKRLGLKRKVPDQLKPYFGSQWWALTWPTLKQILAISRRRAIRQFFKTTWVPDEMFFQTLAASIVPRENIVSTGVTFYHFTHHGKPLVFYNDHFDFLIKQDYFFARKLSPHAHELRDRLDAFIDNAASNTVIPALRKHLESYQHFMSVQWRGLPNRRVIGRQLDPWYGDLEWNKTPYFVILSYWGAQLEPLREALNALPRICCYREIFHGGHIDYGLPDKAHAIYPADKPALRDMKKPNFLVDLINANAGFLTGFVLQLPCGNEIEKIILFDPQATLILVLPEDNYLDADGRSLDWHSAFDNMVMYDHLTEARRAGKKITLLKTTRNTITTEDIRCVTEQIRFLQATVSR